jgi:hypothetical protein
MEPSNPREAHLETLFVQWAAAGDTRSIGAVARKNDIPAHELMHHAKKFGWQKKLLSIYSRAQDRVEDMLVESIAETNRRHLKLLRKLQEEAGKRAEGMVFDKPSDVIRAITSSVEMERKILGMGEKTEDVASMLAERLKQAEIEHSKEPKKIEFDFDPEFVVEPLAEEDTDE